MSAQNFPYQGPLGPTFSNAETQFLIVLFGGSRVVLVSALQVSRLQCTEALPCDASLDFLRTFPRNPKPLGNAADSASDRITPD